MKLSEKLRTLNLNGKIQEWPRYFLDLNQPILPAARQAVLQYADELLGQPVPLLRASLAANYFRTGNRADYETPYFFRRKLLMSYAFALDLTDDEKYFDPMLDALWAILEETSWVIPAHQREGTVLPPYHGTGTDNLDLFSAATGGVLSFVYRWHRARLDAFCPELTPRIDKMLRERILRPLMEEDWMFWMKGVNNWTPWIISNVFTVLIALDMPADERQAVIERCLPMLAAFCDTYHDDGGCDEGPSYWDKAGGSLFDCLELLYDLSGGKCDLFGDEQLRKMGEYVPKVYINGNYFLNFADAPGSISVDGSLLARFGRRVGSTMLENFGRACIGQYRDEPTSRQDAIDCIRLVSHTAAYRLVKDLLTPPEPLPDAPLFAESWLDGLQVMAVRECPDNPKKGLFFACKGGSNAENHNHNDVGSFIVYKDGKPLLPDLGVGTYTKFTFQGDTRYKIFSMRSSFHNLMEVGGYEQLPGGEYHAETMSQGGGTLALELKEACPAEAGVRSWIRTMGLRDGAVRVEDAFTLERPQVVRWYFVTFQKPELSHGAFRLGDAELQFDSSLIATYKEHPFQDQSFISTWKVDRFYRLALETPQPVSEGRYEVVIRG